MKHRLARQLETTTHSIIFGYCHFAHQLRKRRRKPTDKWLLDEVFVTINGHRYYLWRAVDSEGMVLDILLQTRRNAKAAKRFFKQVLRSIPTRPRVIVTDGLRSYNIISRTLLPKVEHRRSKYLNNRAENSHQPTRRRERRMQRFKSPPQAQTFLSIFGLIYEHFHPPKHLLQANDYRDRLAQRVDTWAALIA